MKLDHFVINIDEKYQKNKSIIEYIRNASFPYEPKWGKGTKGFKVSNLWIGNEYLEMVNILRSDGGGWIEEWTQKYKEGHRGMICLMLDTENIDDLYQDFNKRNISVTVPKWLEFKWFFNLFTRRMPWRNCYLPFFENVPFQIGFQEMKDEKSRDFMNQYMVPNARDKGIDGINKVIIRGAYTNSDFSMLKDIFGNLVQEESSTLVSVELPTKQLIEFTFDITYQVEFYTNSTAGKCIEIENVKVYC